MCGVPSHGGKRLGEMGLKCYVASKWEEKERARQVMFELVEHGHSITFDWTTNAKFTTEGALRDVRGVLDADVLVCVLEKDLPYRGALLEWGIALGAGKPVYVIGGSPAVAKNIFSKHPNVKLGWKQFKQDLLGGEDGSKIS